MRQISILQYGELPLGVPVSLLKMEGYREMGERGGSDELSWCWPEEPRRAYEKQDYCEKPSGLSRCQGWARSRHQACMCWKKDGAFQMTVHLRGGGNTSTFSTSLSRYKDTQIAFDMIPPPPPSQHRSCLAPLSAQNTTVIRGRGHVPWKLGRQSLSCVENLLPREKLRISRSRSSESPVSPTNRPQETEPR